MTGVETRASQPERILQSTTLAGPACRTLSKKITWCTEGERAKALFDCTANGGASKRAPCERFQLWIVGSRWQTEDSRQAGSQGKTLNCLSASSGSPTSPVAHLHSAPPTLRPSPSCDAIIPSCAVGATRTIRAYTGSLEVMLLRLYRSDTPDRLLRSSRVPSPLRRSRTRRVQTQCLCPGNHCPQCPLLQQNLVLSSNIKQG